MATTILGTEVTLKRGDSPTVQMEISDRQVDGSYAVADLTGASVKIKVADLDGTLVINLPAVVDSPLAGLVSYAFAAPFMAASGLYRMEWEVTAAGGEVRTYPRGEYIALVIAPDLG